MWKDLPKFLISVEALFGNFYIAVSRGFFIPMLTYSGYDLRSTSYVTITAASIGIVLALTAYRYIDVMSKNIKAKLLAFHTVERSLFALLPFLLEFPSVMVAVYGIALTSSMFTSILMTAALMAVFRGSEFVEASVLRSSVGAAAAIIGSVYSTTMAAAIEPPALYYVAYITASLVGFVATASIIPYRVPDEASLNHAGSSTVEEVEMRKVNTFLMLSLMMGGGNLVGLAWPQLLKSSDYPISLALALNIAGSVGSVVGPYMWRGYRMYVTAILTNTLSTATIPFLAHPLLHVALSAVLSATFVGVNLVASAIYARYAGAVGVIRASVLLSSSNLVGQLIASLIGMSGLGYFPVFALATTLKLLALLIAVLGLPETAIVPTRTAFNYGKLIYSVSVSGYMLTIEASLRVLLTVLRVIAITILIALLIFAHKVLELLLVGIPVE